MLLEHPTVSRLTKSMLLRSMFAEEEIEIEVIDKARTIIYVWNVEREKVWQATMDLESADITTVYAFASTKEEAYQLANRFLTGEVQDKNCNFLQ